MILKREETLLNNDCMKMDIIINTTVWFNFCVLLLVFEIKEHASEEPFLEENCSRGFKIIQRITLQILIQTGEVTQNMSAHF